MKVNFIWVCKVSFVSPFHYFFLVCFLNNITMSSMLWMYIGINNCSFCFVIYLPCEWKFIPNFVWFLVKVSRSQSWTMPVNSGYVTSDWLRSFGKPTERYWRLTSKRLLNSNGSVNHKAKSCFSSSSSSSSNNQ